MRDFRDAKAMAQTIRATLAAKGKKITISESLELIAKAFGAADWNTIAAAIKTAEAEPKPEPARPLDNNQALDGLARALGLEDWDKLTAVIRAAQLSRPPADGRPSATPQGFSKGLAATLHRAVELAAARKHGFTTLEHLLLALTDDPDAMQVLEACQVDRATLKAKLTGYINDELMHLGDLSARDHPPTDAFHRVIQRATIHVQSAGRYPVTGANVLVAIFSERESHAAHFLREQGMERFDAVAFIAHGVRKDGRAA
jgi:hypothetical protein